MATTTRKRPASSKSATPGGIKANKVTSVKKLRDQVKKSQAGNDEWMLRVRPDSEIEVRFLTEPDGWVDYREHFVQDIGFFPCKSSDCAGCDAGNKGSVKYAACVLDLDNDSVRIIALPGSAADQVMKKYDLKSRNTIMDRDYTIQREGKGQNDTTYYVHDGDQKRRRLDKYDVLDQDAILEFLAGLLPKSEVMTDEEEEDEMDEMLPPRRRSEAKAGRRPSRDEDDDDEDDDEDEEEAQPRRRPARKTVKKKTSTTKGKSLR